jgi:hypothetical protein
MERTLRTAKRARARLTARDVVDRSGRWRVWGAAAGAAFVVAEKVAGLPGPWWAWVSVSLFVSGAAAAVFELVRPRGLLASASVLDERLGLKDRLGSALALGGTEGRNDPFVKLAMEESEAVAPTADAALAVPIRFGTAWWTWPMIAAAAVAGAVWAPESSVPRAIESRRAARVETAAEQTKAADEIRDALRVAETAKPNVGAGDDPAGDAAADALAARRLETLAKLEEELRTGKIEPDAAREESAKALEQAAAELAARSQEAQRAADATRDRLAERASPASDEESSLTRAVREGDMRAARQAARELLERVDELPPEERARVVDDMRRLAEELAPEARAGAPGDGAADDGDVTPEALAEGSGATPGEAMNERLLEDLKGQGLSEPQAEEVGKSATQEEAARKLEELGLPPEAARKLAQRVEEDAQRREAEAEAAEKTEELSRTLREAADKLEEPPQAPSPENASKPEEARGTPQGEQPGSASSPPKREGETGAEGKQQPSSTPGEQRGTAGERRPAPEPRTGEKSGKAGEQRPGGQQGNDTSGQRREGAPGENSERSPAAGEKQGGIPSREEPGAPKSGEQTGEKGATSPSGERTAGEQASKEGQPKDGAPAGATPTPGQSPRASEGKQPGDGGEQGERTGSESERPVGEPRAGEKGAGEGLDEGQEPDLDKLPSPDSAQGRAMKKVLDSIRKMERDQQGAAEDRRMSQEMRERAKRMLENATPEQKRKLEQWAKEFAKEKPRGGEKGAGESAEAGDGSEGERLGTGEQGRPDGEGRGGNQPGTAPGNARRSPDGPAPEGFRTDVVDARPREGEQQSPTGGRVAGETSGDGKPGAPMLSKQEAAEAVRRATENVERAIDDRTIPGRYDRLLRRYFKRLPEKLDTPPK